MTTQAFRDTVARFIGYSNNYNTARAQALAVQFEVAEMTVIGWVRGTATPHRLVQEEIVWFVGVYDGP